MAMRLTGAFTAAANSPRGVNIDYDITTATGSVAARMVNVAGTITTYAASNVYTDICTMEITEPAITLGSGSSATNATTLKIVGAPGEATNNRALWVTAGATLLGGTLDVTGTTTASRQVFINGTADENQLLVQGHSTQTSELVVFENSAGTNLLEFTNAGNMEMKTGSITMQNDKPLIMRDSGGVARDILNVSGSDVIAIGNGSLATNVTAALAVTSTAPSRAT